MIIVDTSLPDVKLVKSRPFRDHRGEFVRLYCTETLSSLLGNTALHQINRSITKTVGSVRGLHFQRPPHAERKLVRCLRGRVFDVAVDLRKTSPTYLKWCGTELIPDEYSMLIIPEGFAHGFQVLDPDSELLYLHTAPYTPEAEGGVAFDDPSIAIQWPLRPTEISARDRQFGYIDENFEGLTL